MGDTEREGTEMTTGGRGGYREPANPAAVSGPGALSQRTDGGAGQPIRVASGGAYGERQAAEAQQGAAPMAAGGPGGPSPGGAAPPTPAAPDVGVFGPSSMPNQPITTGATGPMGEPPPDPNLVLRQAVMQYPTPWMLRLLRQRG